MSISTSKSTERGRTLQSEQLQRLAIETSKYLGEPEYIPTNELLLQGEANGYAESEIRALLEGEGLAEANEIRVPDQGDLFGELWRVDDACREPTPEAPTDDLLLDQFRDWLSSKAENDSSHSYTRRAANKRFARGKDVDRFFREEYPTFSTVLITYCAGPPASDETIVEHSDKFYPRAVVRKRRRILKEMGVWSDYAGVSVLAPKKGDDRVPTPDAPTGWTHAHDFLWIPGEVSVESFRPLIERHIANVEGATAEIHPIEEAVTVQVQDSTEVKTPNSVNARGSSLDGERGDTTSLPQELGNNLPLLKSRFDARGLSDYAEGWCARMRLGRDESTDTNGIARFRPLGRFNDVADMMRTRQRIREAWTDAVVLSAHLDGATGDGTQPFGAIPWL